MSSLKGLTHSNPAKQVAFVPWAAPRETNAARATTAAKRDARCIVEVEAREQGRDRGFSGCLSLEGTQIHQTNMHKTGKAVKMRHETPRR